MTMRILILALGLAYAATPGERPLDRAPGLGGGEAKPI